MKQRKLARLLLAAARADVGRWIGFAEDRHTDPTACLVGVGFVTGTESYVLSLTRLGKLAVPLPTLALLARAREVLTALHTDPPPPEAYRAALARLRVELGAP
ncbi:MAG: hypothetical protein KAX64_06515 [Chromatiaceae bacterium]|nr:hypothetical protein [Chromatiaceae bacterium]MBP8282350.1 hypothetical protein [Chromatiaceae bacterium]